MPPARCASMLVPGRYLFAYGVFYPDGDERSVYRSRPSTSSSSGGAESEFAFETPGLVGQADPPARRLLPRVPSSATATDRLPRLPHQPRRSTGQKTQVDGRQETDTISRLVYGFASAYLLTGEDRYLEAAENGTEYLREHLRFHDAQRGHRLLVPRHRRQGRRHEQKIFASEFGDDYDAIPCYEQIYALAGPTQTYRITGDPRILRDVEAHDQPVRPLLQGPVGAAAATTRHIDPITLRSAAAESLGPATAAARTGTRSATTPRPT